MRARVNLNPLPIESRGNERRRNGRVRCDDLTCTLGVVNDLSMSGMRVERRGRKIGAEGEAFAVRMQYGDIGVVLECRIVRVTRTGFRRHSYGLSFVDITAEDQRKLCELARYAAEKKVFAYAA